MKEIAILLTLICSCHLAVQSIPELVSRGCQFLDQPANLMNARKFTGFDCDRPITPSDMQRYHRIYGLPAGKSPITFSDARYRHSRKNIILDHHSSSSLMLETACPSERQASSDTF